MWLSIKRLMFVLPLLFVSFGLQAAGYMDGKEYSSLAAPQPTNDTSKIEVVELFWYGCPHCYQLEPRVEEWLAAQPDDVEFIRMPAILGASWELLARAWYTADLLGVTDKTHKALFDAIHKKRQRFTKVETLRAFFVEQGVSAEDFDNTYNSFGMAAKVNRAKQMTRRYAINGVPAIIVNGKYRTSATDAKGEDNLFKVVNHLIEQERKLAAQ